ncbi:hypothetical protein HDV06_002265 [Boothiomyces sp. JEL0866]|nr:hypothetical protein HDV06_002265 [Boothiomyces sp. JEL0866]
MHLVLLIHGVNGYASDMDYIAEKIHKIAPKDTIIQAPLCNQKLSHDGILVCAQRYLKWIKWFIDKYENINEISMLGHSLGGLYGRCLVGLLYKENIIPDRLKPRNFIALSTPHLPPAHQDWLFGKSLRNWGLKMLIGKSGIDLAMEDDHDKPILLQMSEEPFTKPLSMFNKLILYANIRHDPVINYGNALLCRKDYPVRKAEKLHGQKSWPVVFQHDEPLEDYDCKDLQHNDKIMQQLMQLPWERYGIVPSRPLIAHADMIIKSWSLKHGEPIIDHIAAHFDKMDQSEEDTSETTKAGTEKELI